MKKKKKTLVAVAGTLTVLGSLALARLWAVPKIYLAPDNHTDYIWSASEAAYQTIFLNTLDHYVSKIDSDVAASVPANLQSRFSTDGSLWLWTYQKNRSAAQFAKLMGRVKDGHISSTLSPLVCMYGGQTAEGILRGMYYPGRLERQFGMRFTLAQAMENDTLPYGLGSLWAGAGVKYNWQGVCNCAEKVSSSALGNRGREIYHWVGPDGSQLLTKWYSIGSGSNVRLGGYAEARVVQSQGSFPPTNSNNSVDDAQGAANSPSYPFNILGDFGYGWDDPDMAGHYDDLQTFAKNDASYPTGPPNPNRSVVVSNEEDFFKDFEATYGSSPSLPSFGASFGNDWDIFPTSMAEVSAHVKRAVEKLRTADALATLVSLKNPAFLTSRIAARNQAYMDIGLYFEHDLSVNSDIPSLKAQRIAWQRRLALNEIDPYVNTLQSDAVAALGGMIPKAATRFFVFNPLGHARTDIADFIYPGAGPVRVRDVANAMSEVPSQLVTVGTTQYVRIQAPNVPPAGYKVFEIQTGSGGCQVSQCLTPTLSANALTGALSNGVYNVTVSGSGSITSIFDVARSREFVSSTVNDLGGGGGSLTVEAVGPVSATLVATAGSPSRTTRVTLFLGSDRIEVKNEIKQNMSGWSWGYHYNLTSPDVHHEEVGAIARARKVSAGGNYSDTTAVYDWLTLNHFVDMSGSGSVGVTLSNADAFFFQLGNSSVGTLDTATPSINILGGNDGGLNGITGQAGDNYFMQRFALRTHGAYDAVAAMKFALEHQNPLVTGAVTGTSGYPADAYSYVTVSDPNVLLWALKPADDGVANGVVARLWNLNGGSIATPFSLSLATGIASAQQTTHIETPFGPPATVTSGVLQASANPQQIVTYQLKPVGGAVGGGTVHFSAANYSVTEGGAATITVKRDAPTAGQVTVDYAITDGTGHGNTDYDATTTTGSLTFANGATSRTFSVKSLPNTTVDGNRTVLLGLTNPGGGAEMGDQATAVLTVVDNDVGGKIQFGAASYSIDEGNANALIKITRAGGLASGATVLFDTTSQGTATPGADYTPVAALPVVFAAGQTSQTVTVPILDDGIPEKHKTVSLALSSPTGGAGLGNQNGATLTIQEDNPVLQYSAANFSASESTSKAMITVKRSGPIKDVVTVQAAIADGSAHAGADYVAAPPQTLTFAKGVVSQTFTVSLVNDGVHEPNRTVLLSLSAATDLTNAGQAALGQQSTAVLTINDTDQTPKLQFGASAYNVAESAGVASVVVKRMGATNSTVTVDYAATGGSAVAGTNYDLPPPGTLTFLPGVVTQTLPVTIHNTGTPAGNLKANLALSSPTATDNLQAEAALGSPSATVLTILSDDPLLQFSAPAYKVGEAGPTATITVKRSGPTTGQVKVDYADAGGGSASSPQDYSLVPGTLTFAPGVTTQTFPVTVTDAGLVHGDKTVNLSLSPQNGAALGAVSTAVLTLVTDDPSLQFSTAAYTVAESASKATITVKRTGNTTPAFSVPVTVTPGSAVAGVNYTPPNTSTVDFAKGAMSRTLTIPILNDTADEPPPLTVNLALGIPVPPLALLGSLNAATLTISDNDVAGTVQFSVLDYSVSETGGTAVVTVTRSGGSASGASIHWAATAGTAVDGTNFTAASGTLTFDQGQTSATFTVDVIDDGVPTGNLTVNLALSSPLGGAVVGARSTATLWIVDAE